MIKARVHKKEWLEVVSDTFSIEEKGDRIRIFDFKQRMSSVNLISIEKIQVKELIEALQKYEKSSE